MNINEFDNFDREIEEIVNIFWEPDVDEDRGHTSIFRVYDQGHKEDLMKPSKYNESVVAPASGWACPLNTGKHNSPQSVELDYVIPSWIDGNEDEDFE